MTAHIGGGDETDSEDEIDVENVAEEEEEEEDVMEAPPKPASKGSSGKRKRGSAEKEDPDGVSPLDALLQMTSKAFDGRQDAKNQGKIGISKSCFLLAHANKENLPIRNAICVYS